MSARSTAPADPLPQIGRFTVLRQLGSGGMGVVYTAYDPDLDRKVALKLVHLRSSGDNLEAARARLLREAQSAASLSHPNVVAIYDVGAVDDRVFLAMEYIHGDDLRVYAQPPRPWRDVLAAYRQAGAGLAAAHRAGLVHRDFKPDNVLIDHDGRVRVVDFGLAARADLGDLTDVPLTASNRGFHKLASGTHSVMQPVHSAMVGTPAYMAPEQHLGAPADARADQFSFCAALYEGLYGQRPIPGATVGELRDNLLGGVHHSPPPGSPIPPWLRRILLRGLAIDPEHRFPSMQALLAALAHDPNITRRRVLLATAAAVAVASAIAYALTHGERHDDAHLADRQAACLAVGADLRADTWTDERRAAAEQALLATKLPYAGDTWTRVRARLDAHAHALEDMAVETCTSAQIRGDLAPAAHDRRIACLRRVAAELDGLGDSLVHADARVAERAVQAAAALTAPARCAAPDTDHDVAVDPTRAAAVDDLRLRLARARAHAGAGRYADAATETKTLTREAAALGERGLQAEAMLRGGQYQESSGDIKSAETTLTDAYFLADQAARDELRAEIATLLAGVVGLRLARTADGLIWLRHAWAVGQRIDLDRELRVRLLSCESGLLRAQLDYTHAGEKIAEAATLAGQVFAADDPRLATIVLNLGVNAYDRGDYSEAERLYERALETLGHTLGPQHPDLAPMLNNLGAALDKQGRFPAAIAAFERAMAIREASVGPRHPGVAISLGNLGELNLRLHQPARAEPQFRRAIAIFESALGPDHPNLGSVLVGLGRALVHQHRLAEARPLHTRALQILEKARGADDLVIAFPLLGLAELELAADDPAAAIPLATRALTLRAADKPDELASAQFLLARALHAAHRDPSRAVTLADAAERGYSDAGPGFKPELDDVLAWRRTLAAK